VHLGAHVAKSSCVAFGRPSCELTLRCVRAPNLGEAVLKNLPPSQNQFLSVLRLVFLPSAPLCGHFCYGSSCVSLRPFVRFVTALRAFGHPSCQLVLHFIWAPILPTGLAFREPHVYMITRFFRWNLSNQSLRIFWNLRWRIFWVTKGKARRVGKRGTQTQCKARWQDGCPNARRAVTKRRNGHNETHEEP
jgi:hypothetical protein